MGQQRPDGRTERGWKRAAPINIDTQSGEKKRQTPSDKDSEGTGYTEPGASKAQYSQDATCELPQGSFCATPMRAGSGAAVTVQTTIEGCGDL
ncbi:UNVERIFIED_CONTAM: hypothetical protein FKN15_065781 [Acipenser sinensis]